VSKNPIRVPFTLNPGVGSLYTIDKGALFIDDISATVGSLSLTQYLAPRT
jgi:hypothetical protein